MVKEAIYHRPYSEYCYALSISKVVFRLRAKIDDLKACILYYGDRMDPYTPIRTTRVNMKVRYQDELFDYYEAECDISITRMCYYFELFDNEGSIYYYNNDFHKIRDENRQKYYNFHYIREEDIAKVPDWAKKAIIYQIYPDSFATYKDYISSMERECLNTDGSISQSKFGGTIRGITENIDYLVKLGITCIYLTPIFASNSWHKYDIIDYTKIDPCLGSKDDVKEMIKLCHEHDIRVIFDGVFNHCSTDFFSFKDVLKNGKESKYVEWFYIYDFPIKTKPFPNYECFGYVATMPKLNTGNREVIDYILNVVTNWILEFDIDGLRLDVANEVNFDFWREFRKVTKEVKPDLFLIGEIWDDAGAFLQGEQFDSAMNYNLYFTMIDFFGKRSITCEVFDHRVQYLLTRYKKQIQCSQLNLVDSHDVPRFLSEVNEDRRRFKQGIVFMMTYVGIPMIFYGDEKGMVGREEIDYRSPMIWENTKGDLFLFYQRLIKLRKEYMESMLGEFRCLCREEKCYSYIREGDKSKILVVFNLSEDVLRKEILINKGMETNGNVFDSNKDDITKDYMTNNEYHIIGNKVLISLLAYETAVIIL